MSAAQVHVALTTAVRSAVGSTPLQQENAPFTKPTNSKWAAYFYRPNQPIGFTLGDSGYEMHTGIAQVDFHYPSGTGDAAADTDLNTFDAAFKRGHGTTYSGQAVVYTGCGAPFRRKEENWFIVSVTIGWYALVPRS